MPPDGPLSAGDIATLVRWVELGAPDPRTVEPSAELPDADWWSLRPLSRPAVPGGGGASHPVDAIIDARLREAGLCRSPPADRRTLIRRVYFDLHGLPPTPEQVAAFAQDSRADAWPRLVDALLDSPRYGERWARHWLDVIHFADTAGFEHDVFREHAWRYRDYVIAALNADTPWQDFIRQQLAADVFFPEQSHLIAALGFLGAGPLDLSTASTAPVTFDYMDRDDIVTQTMAAFASTTANCARCHSHKFDPITQEDYYALQAVFAGIGRGDRDFDEDPDLFARRRHWQGILDAVAARDAAVLLADEPAEHVIAWETARGTSPAEWLPLTPEVFLSSHGAELERLADGSIRAGGSRPDVDTYTITATPSLSRLTAIRLEVLADGTLPMSGPGRQDNGNLHLNEVEIQIFRPGETKSVRAAIPQATADFNQAGWTIAHALDGDPKTAWGIYPEVGKDHEAVFELGTPIDLEPGSRLVVTLKQLHGAGHLIGRCRLSATDAPPSLVSSVPHDVRLALQTPSPERTPEQRLAIAAHVMQRVAAAELAKLPPPVKVYAAAANYERAKPAPAPLAPKVVNLLIRGDINRPGAAVVPGALSAITALPGRFDATLTGNESHRRAALAEWIASPDNPLTWRSIANRVWQHHFGVGICDTPSDFGRMGGTPSHPELLDWLACELRDNAGSLKHLHRVILNSETYRQSSAYREDGAEADGENRLLWRAPRQRLDAESFHDAVLAISGRLDLTMGGPGIQRFTTSPGQQLTPKVHYDRFDWSSPQAGRRAIYRVVWRGIPEPLMEALDFPDLGLLSPTRAFSVSALQSLTLWNHPFVLHHCEAAANQLTTARPTAEEQVREAFVRVLLREPSNEELGTFVSYRDEVGPAAVVRLLLNSNEFLFVD